MNTPAYTLTSVLGAIEDGRRPRRAEVNALASADGGAELELLMAAARAVRERAFGETVTYSPKVFIPLTKLCRDVCHYCTFARPPRRGERAFMSIDEVLAVARRGRDAGCHEALFTLGERPERRYRVAREELAELGCSNTIEYLERAARAVLEETGLLPHLNPGTMSESELRSLRPVSASMGMMLESASWRLTERGMPHYGSPDKRPDVRLETIAAAGRAAIPFTSGILIGIGETRIERLESLLRVAELHKAYGHVQEVIVQNFRAKADTLMHSHPEPSLEELLWTIAVARVLLPAEISVQAPPNLSDDRFARLLDAGINDWGGISPVTVDHVNPEAPWPALDRLEAATIDREHDLIPRLALYPAYQRRPERWLDEAVRPAVLAAADSLGYARRWPWQAGSSSALPAAFPGRLAPDRRGSPLGSLLERARQGEELDEDELELLLSARGGDWAAVIKSADELRREVCGDRVTYVVTRNINYTNVCYFRCGFCAFSKGKLAANLRGRPYVVPVEEVIRRAREAWDRGATEVCLQGGIHPGFDGDYYLGLLTALRAELPELHVHAFSPLEVWQGAATLGIELDDYLARLRAGGLGSLPGTAAEILDDEIRAIICPDKLDTAQWREVVTTAHRRGLPTTSTIMFGHVEGPRSWARHLRVLRDIQAETGGITEFVPLPFVHMEAPIALRGAARHGPTLEESLLMHAVARLALHPVITNIQASWVKLGPSAASLALKAGANDLGGTLMNESISRAAGAAHGQEMPPEQMDFLIRSIDRMPKQRTTLYKEPGLERVRCSYGASPLSPAINPPAKEANLPVRHELVRSAPSAARRARARTAGLQPGLSS
jgi:FO synthase